VNFEVFRVSGASVNYQREIDNVAWYEPLEIFGVPNVERHAHGLHNTRDRLTRRHKMMVSVINSQNHACGRVLRASPSESGKPKN
jgi:hypothetical protein